MKRSVSIYEGSQGLNFLQSYHLDVFFSMSLLQEKKSLKGILTNANEGTSVEIVNFTEFMC